MVRSAERMARKNGLKGIIIDGNAYWTRSDENTLSNPPGAINKSGAWADEDMEAPEIKALVQRISVFKDELKKKGLFFTNTAGMFSEKGLCSRSELVKLWENAWTIHHSGVTPDHKVLDVGGASTAFVFFLASMGCSVAIADNDWSNCGTVYNTNYVAKRMKWNLKAYDRDAGKPLPFPDNCFDRAFSICTLEHLTSSARRSVMKEIGRVLKPGGIVGLTIDYAHDREILLTDKGLRFAYKEKIELDIIEPSGLSIYGNTDWIDAQMEENFIGALFLKKD